AVRLTVPVIRVRRGLSPPSHQLDTTSNRTALSRRAPCLAHQRKAGQRCCPAFKLLPRPFKNMQGSYNNKT
ncbi:MAG: hypothetical protein OEM65_08860, partial [Desulfuromonadales bacterium]|nr:hypothetical protein [Desulfuromonadales bacterium]